MFDPAPLRAAARHAESFLGSLPDRPVRATTDAARLRADLGGPLPDTGVAPEQVIDDLARAADPGLVATAGPRFFGFVIGGSLPAALAADWLTSASEGFIAPGDAILATAWSVAVEPGTTAEAWLHAYFCRTDSTPCKTLEDGTVPLIPVTMDGHSGSLVQFDDTQAFILADDRMYVAAVWEGDSDPRTAPYGGATRLIEGYLSTMHLLPGGPAPSSVTSPLPS